ESMQGAQGSAVIDPGLFFRMSTIITVVGGTLFLMWLGEQITARGIGNGISLIIFSGIVAGLPSAIISTLELGNQGQFSFIGILMIGAMVLGTIVLIVFMERAQRRILVQYPKRQVGAQQMTQASQNHLPLKLNMSGVIPPIFASSLLFLPMTIVGFAGLDAGDGFLADLSRYMSAGSPIHMIVYAELILFFAFFYTAVVFNPEENAEMLRKHGGFIAGVRPGKSTAEFLDYVLTRITVLGALYMVFISLMPEYLISHFGLPFYFGGTSLLIVVSVTMDTVAQINSHMLAHQYEGFLKKTRLGKGKK
ncbi:MAG: preprotein translocase subunit SecY, partial [Pseudomonadota bacterium]